MPNNSAVDGDIALARTVLPQLDFFSSERIEEIAITPLGGLTNRNFRIDCDGDSYVLRVPGAGTDGFIDRSFEAAASRAAAAAGVSPAVVFVDPATGYMVREYISATAMTQAGFATVPGAATRAGRVLRRLHTSGATFGFRFDLFSMIDEYLGLLGDTGTRRPDGLRAVLDQAAALRPILASRPVPLCPCHCDLLAHNFLDTPERMWLVDWEFSGMNDPMWDLADAIVECALSPAREAELLTAYFERAPSAVELGRVAIYKALCNLLWALWGYVQMQQKGQQTEFDAYAQHRFKRSQALMSDPMFAQHLKAVGG